MIRNKLFLRSFLLIAKRTIVSKFPITIRTASSAKALHQKMPSALEGSSIFVEDELFLPVIADVFSIVWTFYLKVKISHFYMRKWQMVTRCRKTNVLFSSFYVNACHVWHAWHGTLQWHAAENYGGLWYAIESACSFCSLQVSIDFKMSMALLSHPRKLKFRCWI